MRGLSIKSEILNGKETQFILRSHLNERLDFAPGDVYDLEKFEQNLRGNEKQDDVSALYLDNGYLTFNLQTKETKLEKIQLILQLEWKNEISLELAE